MKVINESRKIGVLKEGKRTPQQVYDYNYAQTEVGSTLRTLGDSPIQRSKKFGVGKDIGERMYFHKNYVDRFIPEFFTQDEFDKAEKLVHDTYPDFQYNCLSYAYKKRKLTFQEAPDFDTIDEPRVGKMCTVNLNDMTIDKLREKNEIWHHKWSWVDNDYKGFNVQKSWEHSRDWLSRLNGVASGSRRVWDKQLQDLDK